MNNKALIDKLAQVQKKIEQARAELEDLEMRLTNAFGKFEQKRTERCQVCDKTYPPSEIVKRGQEQLCLSCDLDKYPLRDEDIPF